MRRYPDVVVTPLGEKIIALVEGHYPQESALYVTSSYRNEPGSHHIGLSWNGSPTMAVDFGTYDDPTPDDVDQLAMRDFAKWCQDSFQDLIAELIHTTPYADDAGFYVAYGRRSSPPASVTLAHLNHVHLAMSDVSVGLAEQRLSQQAPPARSGPDWETGTAVLAGVWPSGYVVGTAPSEQARQFADHNVKDTQTRILNKIDELASLSQPALSGEQVVDMATRLAHAVAATWPGALDSASLAPVIEQALREVFGA